MPKKSTEQVFKSLWQATFWISFPFGVVSFLLPVYGKEIGANALEIGGFFSAYSLVPALIRPFLGRALDRWGRRPFLLIGLGGVSAFDVRFFTFRHCFTADGGQIHPGYWRGVFVDFCLCDGLGHIKTNRQRTRFWFS